ncbi:enoyl-CoA hydratase/isomerase family protein [Psychromarinibacter sp. C21-152]|uniref:3-hydroxyisobutyryl-CoA hydrolase n=1 Tax=Psychromarinibacter sediminicola TaxID=3033385 RepID=A0AAE3T8I7_9RHOB|nr:enoyl-CoA hydratase/isomerase family protein [Psychromarinibacter sediminicola]MDF0601460.1 enoyl-CoA hydratase/isomerase family protein [Psychromarinibacter sediminicola]
MSEIDIRIEGRAGRITLTRPKALNALTWDMALAIERALEAWRDDDAVALVLIDGDGDKAFCAGGDIAELYRTGRAGDYDYGRRFWLDEYRMNARLARFPKPVVAFLHGFVMGGGVGVGCHVSHRVVCESSRMAMPECGIGLVPDVGGSLLLSRAPGRLGAYLGLTGDRMRPGDALHAGFADAFVPEDGWAALKAELCRTGRAAAIAEAAAPAPESPLAARQGWIDGCFGAGSVAAILEAVGEDEAATALRRGSPLSLACTLEMLRRHRAQDAGIEAALTLEYRFTARAMERGDFLEGVRAAIIDKDRTPVWRHAPGEVTPEEVAVMLAPLGADELNWEDKP